MARRLVAQTNCSNRPTVDVRTYRDTEWCEFIVYYVIDGKRDEPSSYHTDDKEEAVSAMLRMSMEPASTIPAKARQ